MVAGMVWGGTAWSVMQFNQTAYRVDMVETGERKFGQVYSRLGAVLHTFGTGDLGSVQDMDFVSSAENGGKGARVIVSYTPMEDDPRWKGQLCIFDAGGDFETPLWMDRIASVHDIPDIISRNDSILSTFSPRQVEVEDFFPKHPGKEMLAVMLENGSCSSVRIYSLEKKEILYEVWVDTVINDAYWLRESGRLVLCGLNTEAYWELREIPPDTQIEFAHPTVLFALEPVLHHRVKKFVSPSRFHGRDKTLVWYKCLLPPVVSNHLSVNDLFKPGFGLDSGRYVHVQAMGRIGSPIEIDWGMSYYFDEDGNELREFRGGGDPYKRNGNIPKDLIESAYWGKLPPIVEGHDPYPAEGKCECRICLELNNGSGESATAGDERP